MATFYLSQSAQQMILHSGLAFLACTIFANTSFAQVYKCTFADEVTHQNKVIYSDAPCSKAQKQTLTDIQAKSQFNLQPPQATSLVQANDADAAVTRAVLGRDFKLAKSLATTKEHWRLIAIAEGEAPPPVIVANTQPVTAADECAFAKNDFDFVSRNAWRDKDLVAAKKSVMYVACGMPEPARAQPIFVGRTYGGFGGYGGLYHGRRYPNQLTPHQIRPHGALGANPNHYYHGRNNSRNDSHNDISGARFNTKTKHVGFGVNNR